MQEIWKDVVGYEGLYQVSNTGKVRALKDVNQYCVKDRIRNLSQSTSKKGYKVVSISKNKIKKTAPVHRLVAIAFIPNPDNLPQVNHIDGVKTNNNVDNLEWCDNDYNMQHAKENGLLDKRTEKLKKPVKQYDKNWNFIKDWDSAKDVYRALKIRHIADCCKGKRQTAGGFKWRYANENN